MELCDCCHFQLGKARIGCGPWLMDGCPTGITAMTATLKFLSRFTNDVFESQMQRAARKICER